MARTRHLINAPITEAVFDFRTRLPLGVDREFLRNELSVLRETYPEVEEAWLIEGSLAFSSESANPLSSSSKKANGFFVRSQDGKQLAQFRFDGFTFNRLAPYTSWDAIAPEAFRLWEIYCRILKPDALYRVAVRYINHIPLPQTPVDMDDLLVSAPKVPVELPQIPASFLTRVVVPLPMPNTHVAIVHAYNTLPAATADAILLDLDVARNEEMGLSTDTLRPIFEQLRVFKNKAFFGSLTEGMVGRLE